MQPDQIFILFAFLFLRNNNALRIVQIAPSVRWISGKLGTAQAEVCGCTSVQQEEMHEKGEKQSAKHR